jgi:hypothetical protein
LSSSLLALAAIAWHCAAHARYSSALSWNTDLHAAACYGGLLRTSGVKANTPPHWPQFEILGLGTDFFLSDDRGALGARHVAGFRVAAAGSLLSSGRCGFLNLAPGDPGNRDSVADHVVGALLAF